MRPSLEVADIFRAEGPAYRERYGETMPLRHKRAMRAIELCRTAALGGHLDRCERCGYEHNAYNSCRNRHCPKCQFLATERWVEARKDDLLPIPYYHVVFTLPEALRPIALENQRVVYDLLLKTAAQTLLELARDPKYLGTEVGLTTVLHTWSQTLIFHPHVHCVVTGGGLAPDGTWKPSRRGFLLPVKVLSRLFRGKFLARLKEATEAGHIREPLATDVRRRLYDQEWNVYCKRPFAGPEQVIDYLGHYTHRVAISNHRLVDYDGEKVRFTYRDRKDGDRRKVMTLPAPEFVRRFLLHILPDGFVKIRHCGLHGNRVHQVRIARCRELLLGIWTAAQKKTKASWQEVLLRVTGIDIRLCPECGGPMLLARIHSALRAPPGT